MSTSPGADNPFATRYIRPGAINYLLPAGVTLAALVEKLRRNAWQGQIVGPHGSGKSTLLASLMEELAREGRAPYLIALHDAERSIATDVLSAIEWRPELVLTIDGYEQLSRWSRWRLARRLRRAKAGCLVTSHATVGLPTLLEVKPSLAIAQQIADELQTFSARLVHGEDVAQCYNRCEGNIRETLFQLYDLYEARRRAI